MINPAFKSFLINATKQAISAAIATLVPIFNAPDQFNLHSAAGIRHVLYLVAAAIGTREALVYGPKLIAWTQSSDTPSSTASVSVAPNQVTVTKSKYNID